MIGVLIGQHRGLVVVEVKLSSHYLNLVMQIINFRKATPDENTIIKEKFHFVINNMCF